MSCVRSIKFANFLSGTIIKRNLRMSMQLQKQVLDKIKKQNPYYEKYATKIANLQQISPEEFLSRIGKFGENETPKNDPQRTYAELLNPKKPIASTSEVPHKKLSDIMKLELIKNKDADDIKHIWFEYHKQKDVIAAILTNEQYEMLMIKGKEFPIFLLPLPRSEGYEFMMLQFSANTVHFTPLLAYQVHKENAPECLNMVFYTETSDKGIVLMRGEYDKQVLNAQEAQCLANELQLYYRSEDPARLKLLKIFSTDPNSFKHMDLIKQLEEIELK